MEIWRKTKEMKNLITLISAIFDFFCQSHTVNMWSLQSSITLRWWPESWKRVRQKQNLGELQRFFHFFSEKYKTNVLQFPGCTWILTALEKDREPTPRSNVPMPITCRVERETLSQIRTWGCSGWNHHRHYWLLWTFRCNFHYYL